MRNPILFVAKIKFGFTAIELVVVLAIIGILATVSVPVISQFLPGIRLTGTTRTLTGDLREAQERAVTSQNQNLVRFFLGETPPKYQLVQVENSVEAIIREEQLPSGESLALAETIGTCTSLPAVPNCRQIIFSPDGGPSSAGDITISLGGKSKVINVSPAGFIKLNN